MKTFTIPGRVCSTSIIREIAQQAEGKYILLQLKPEIQWVYRAQERMEQVADMVGAVMVYADRFINGQEAAPVIDYQAGALRDDFEFGGAVMVRTEALQRVAQEMDTDYQFAGFYDLRLRLSRIGAIEHIPEFLYYEIEEDMRKSGEKLFDYVDPRNRQVQIEMEQCVTNHLKHLVAQLDGSKMQTWQEEANYPVTASVIIPCKNRVRTIADAIESAANQVVREGYSYNVIVVDDNSTDGSAAIIQEKVNKYAHVIYIAQDKTWHAIGGNWNMAFHDARCGKYAIQLDSDDTYHDQTTVQRFIDKFEEGQYAMVIGTYQMTDIDGNILPPGVIDHREWTDENGMNNALRINGLGAPRGFATGLLRTIDFPTTKYGEDYAVGLRISRQYKIGRIYDVVYHCRRWEDNSDANCNIEQMNRNNWYKDRIRTWELMARKK